ncbi:MAG: hypothetical protein QM766_11175 [Burkholderiaceae bacterium]
MNPSSGSSGSPRAVAPHGSPAASPSSADPAQSRRIRRGRLKALVVLLVCAAPVVASYLTYYVIQPSGRTNYGQLLAQRSVSELAGTDSRGEAVSLAALEGRWLMVLASAQACRDEACARRLYLSRQVRTTAGKDMDRVERVLLLTGPDDPPPALLAQHPGLHVIRVAPERFDQSFGSARPASDPAGQNAAAPAGDASSATSLSSATSVTSAASPASAASATSPSSPAALDALYMVDPLGHLMMRYPPDFDPNRLKKDLAKLLRASRVG